MIGQPRNEKGLVAKNKMTKKVPGTFKLGRPKDFQFYKRKILPHG